MTNSRIPAHSFAFNPYTALNPEGVGKNAALYGIPRLFILRKIIRFPPITATTINIMNATLTIFIHLNNARLFGARFLRVPPRISAAQNSRLLTVLLALSYCLKL